MPIDSPLKRRFHLVDGINSYADAMANPELLAQEER